MDTNYFLSAAMVGNALFWATRDKGDIMKFDMERGRLEYVLPGKYLSDGDMMYSAVVCSDEKNVYGVTKSGKKFFQYSVEQNNIEYWDINMETYSLDLICYANKIADQVIIIPRYKNVIVKVDLEKRKCTERQLFELEMKETHNLCVHKGDKVYVINEMAKKLLVISFKDDKEQSYKLPANIEEIDDISIKEEQLYILTIDNKLYEWDFVNEECEEKIDITKYIKADCNEKHKEICCSQDYIWISLARREAVLSICKETYKVKDVISHGKCNADIDRGAVKLQANGKWFWPMISCHYILQVDIEKNRVDFMDCPGVDSESLERYFGERKGTVLSEERIPLEEYINYIATGLQK